jgi:hypothetical protein
MKGPTTMPRYCITFRTVRFTTVTVEATDADEAVALANQTPDQGDPSDSEECEVIAIREDR